jgi:hypothetical protein
LVLQGFNVNNNSAYFFPPLRPDQVVIGVPSSQGAAGSGQISNAGLQQAFTTLKNKYPNIRGIMSWSINWDALQNNNSFVISNRTYLNGPGAREVVEEETQTFSDEKDGLTVHPNPVVSGGVINLTLDRQYEEVNVSIIDINGVSHGSSIYKNTKAISHPVPALSGGLHVLKVVAGGKSWTKKIITH